MKAAHILAFLMLALLEGGVAILTQKQQTLHFLQRYDDTIKLIQQEVANSDQQAQLESPDAAQSSQTVTDVAPEENAQAPQENQAAEQVAEAPAQEAVQTTEQPLTQENSQATESVQDANQLSEEVSQTLEQEIIATTESQPQETPITSEEVVATTIQDPADTLSQQAEQTDQTLSSDIPLNEEQAPGAVDSQTVDNTVSDQSLQSSTVNNQQNETSQCQQIIIQQVDNDSVKVEDLDALYERIEDTLNETFSEYSQYQLEIIQQIEGQLDEIQSENKADTVIILKALLQDKQQQLADVNAELIQWNSQFGIQCLDYTDCTNCLIKSKCVWCADAEICMDVERAELCVVKYKQIDQCPASFSVDVSTEEQLINYDDDEIFGRNQDKLTLDDDMQRQIAGSVEKEKPETNEDYLLHKKVELEEYIIILQDIIDEKEANMNN